MDGSDDSSDDSSDDGSDDGSDDSSDGTDSTTSTMMQMLPGALSQTMTSAGGVGIADELYQSMKARAGITDTSGSEAGS
jgi:Rod binding domain-containing protein